jgi:hypothetical protein
LNSELVDDVTDELLEGFDVGLFGVLGVALEETLPLNPVLHPLNNIIETIADAIKLVFFILFSPFKI